MNETLTRLAAGYWEFLSALEPTASLLRGDHRFDDQIEDVSLAAENEAIDRFHSFAAAAGAIDATDLNRDEQVTRAVLIHDASSRAGELESRYAEINVNPVFGFHIDLPSKAALFPLTEPAHADAIVEKYRKAATLFDQLLARLRQGVARDRTPAAGAAAKTIAQLDDYLAAPLEQDLFLAVTAPPDLDSEADWREQLSDVVRDEIRPALLRYRDGLSDEILPHSRPEEQVGLCWLVDGEAAYARAVAHHTTLHLTPLEIHRTGLDAIAQLGDEYRELGGRVLGTTDLTEIFDRLRNDPSLRFADSDAVRSQARRALDRAQEAIPRWFGRLPQTDCVVVDIPEPAARDATIAYYYPPAADGTRPGSYYLNVSEPTTRTIFESEVLAFHESVPGHHLQIAIAQELEGIPDFRRHLLVTAYVEGWGLYCERLADEMGLYSGDLERLGVLSFDSWRAGRLVVDTGIHALGWSRREAVDFLMENSPQAPNNIVNEVERYIAWPGQALAYRTGQQEIMRLRRDAEARLGSGFDIRAFHDVVLGSGGVTLGILSDLVGDWVAS